MFHVEEIKPSNLKLSCPHCDKKFFSKNAQKYHRKYAHKNEAKRDDKSELPCEFCGRVFLWKNRGNLKVHMKNIHGVQDYDVELEEHSAESSNTSTVTNFMNFLNALTS